MPMEFYSCLFPSIELEEKVNEIAPKSLKDLHLDQLFGYIFQEKYLAKDKFHNDSVWREYKSRRI